MNFGVNPPGSASLAGNTSQEGIPTDDDSTAVTATPNAGYYWYRWEASGTISGGGFTQSSQTWPAGPVPNAEDWTVTAVSLPNYVNLTTPTASINEGFNIQFKVKADVAVTSDVGVRWTVTHTGGTENADFTGGVISDVATITPADGTNDVIINVSTENDTLYELNETFTLTISIDSGPAFTGAANTATGTIQSPGDTYNAQIGATAYNPIETDSDFTLNIPVTLDQTVPGGATVSYSVTPASATAVSDYVDATGGTLTYTDAQTSRNIQITIIGDDIVEQDETFSISLSAGANQTVSNTPATVTITDDDTATLTVTAAASQDESTTPYQFTVMLDSAVEGGFSVPYTTDSGTAAAGTDFTDNDSTLNFTGTAGENFTVDVAINDDAIVEASETFTFTLGALTPAEVDAGDIATSGSPAVGTITSDDTTTLTITDVSLAEGSGGGTPTDFDFTVNLPDAVQGGFDLAFTVNDGTATDADDFDVVTTSPVTFAGTAGENQIIRVAVHADDVSEDDESFTVTLGALSNILPAAAAGITTGDTASGTIIYDDYEASLGADITVNEGNTPADDVNLTFTVNLDRPNKSGGDIDLKVNTMNDTALSGSDYAILSDYIVSIADTEQSETFNVAVLEDTVVEHDEPFLVILSTASTNTTVPTSPPGADRAVGTIDNDDAATLAIDDVSKAEGANGDATVYTFTVTFSGDVDQALMVDYTTTNDSATSGSGDFLETSGTLSFAGTDGETQTIDVVVNGDDVVEYDETFFVTLSNISAGGKNVTFSDNIGTGSILNDDKYKISVDDVTTDEPDGAGATTTATFTISLSQSVLAGQTVTVAYATGNPTGGESPIAVTGTDYTAIAASTVDFTEGQSSKTVPVTVLNDTADVDIEYYYLNVSAVSANADLVDGVGLGTIVDNEYGVTAAVDAAYDDGTICRGASPCAPTDAAVLSEIIERSSDSSAYTVTADTGFCIADVQRNGNSVLGGTVPLSPYSYTATNIQDDPTDIMASFRSEIHFSTNIEPVEAQTYGRWRLKDTANNVYILPGVGSPTTADPAAAWLNHGDTVIIPCDQSGFDLEFKDVSGWYPPVDVNYSIPPGAGTNYTATGTYISKTVQLTIATSGGTGTETVNVEPAGSQEGGAGTYTYQLIDNQTVLLTANASTTPATIFLRWTGPVSDEFATSTEVVMDADKTVTAIFGTPGVDNDGDGYLAGDDCDDTDPTIHPDAPELCGDNIDQDCSGGDPVCTGDDADDDNDGYTENQGDCNDGNAAINPGATEICGNSVDEDCFDGPRDCGTEVICSEYSERPLETQAQSAAPNVVFVLDDSGSMRWTTMTEESNGLFSNNYYIWSISGSGSLDSSERLMWRSQYAAYNKMYYNPSIDYAPWPRWNTMADTEDESGTKIKSGGTPPDFDANRDTPRSDPTDDGNTLNLNADFFSVQEAGISATPITQWVTVTRNSDSGSSTAADAIRLRKTDGSVTIIVDNDDGAAFYEENGTSWNWSGAGSRYDGNARYNSSDGTPARSAKWRFDIATAGNYYVDAWWPEYTNYDKFADYEITYNNGGSTATHTVNQRLNGGKWNKLGSADPASAYYFGVQATAAASTLDVKNAHYFIWVDHNDDGNMLYKNSDGAVFTTGAGDNTSEVYLINLPGSGGTYDMKFYRFRDIDNDNKVDDNELQEVLNTDTYWSSIQPKNEGGTARTAVEERQNFANWFSFYRRREFTAKAAIGRTINGTEGMNIGILGINGRIQEEVVPIGVEGRLIKIVDNEDGGYSEPSGSWNTWSTSTAVSGNSRWTNSNGGKARFAPNVSAAEAGVFTVYAWWPCWTGWDSSTKYTIVDKDGTSHVVSKDQRQGGSEGCGQWVQLGLYAFDETGGQYVQVESTGDYVAADAVKFVSTGAQVTVNQSDYILNKLYQVYSSGGTPLRRGLQNAGKYFDNEDSGASGGLSATAPWASAIDGGGCQRAFAILMTDGYYNGYTPSPSVGNEDSDGNRPSASGVDAIGSSAFDSGIFAGTGSNTLADVAMYYYEKDLHSGLPNDVPVHNYDLADHQHMVTYGVSFGVKGTLDPTAYPKCLPDTPPGETTAVCPTWTYPDSNARKIDDLYHASINGRGKYLNAANPGELVAALKEIIDDVADTTGTGSSVSINAQELKEGTLLFQASYLTGSWRGDLKAKTLDPATGEIQATLWSAAEQLHNKTQNSRLIVTYDGTTGRQFRFNDTLKDLSRDQAEKLLNLAPGTITTADFSDLETSDYNGNGIVDKTDLQKLVEYLRGDATNEGTATGTFRQRARKDGETDIGALGDIVHSAPLHVADVVYVGSNDGMLHAFDDTTGEELFAYVPNLIYDDLDELASQAYQHNYYVDNSPYSLVIKDGGTPLTLLTGTLGRGGKGVYALNITSPNPATEADAKALARWEYPTTPGSDSDLGYTFGRAFIVNSNLGYVVIFGNGYQSANGRAVLYVLNANTGALLGKIDTGVGSSTVCNGLSAPVLIDFDFDGKVDYAYAGDLLGNMWKFDLTGTTIASGTVATDWKVAYNTQSDHSGVVMPMFQAKNKNGHRQPITTKPDVIAHPDASLGGYMVIFGTGRYLGNADFGDNSIQSIYGIWDWQAAWDKVGTSADKYYGSFGLPAAGTPPFGRMNYVNKPEDQDFVVGEVVTGAETGATGEIIEIETIGDTAGTLKLDTLSATPFKTGEFITTVSVTVDARVDGDFYAPVFRPLSNLEGNVALGGVAESATLLEQNQIAFLNESRFMSNNPIDWFEPGSTSKGALEHVGWYFDLPGNNEKMIRDPLIRNGIAFVISSVPSSSPCASGGSSIIHALDAAAGGRSLAAVFDISGPDGVPDGEIDEHDLVNIGTPDNPRYVPPTGLRRDAMWYTPAVLAVQDAATDVMYFSTSEGDVQLMKVQSEKVGVYYWREIE